MKNTEIKTIVKILKEQHPDPKTELNHKNEYELFCAVCLSAQTTDKKVNQVTPKLFNKYKDFVSLSKADVKQVGQEVYGVNFHVGKAERLVKAAQMILSVYSGELPRSMEELVKIPGVARKTANVLLQELWEIAEGIVVDTHVSRVSNRIGLTTNNDPKKIEIDLMQQVPQDSWRNFSGAMVLHGRYVCVAIKPKCDQCPLSPYCLSSTVDIK